MIKTLLIIGGVILFGGLFLVIWACCKAAGDADREMGYEYITEEDLEAM